jgi:pyrroloquinoline quinone (PQQ) biosynthesis protein C
MSTTLTQQQESLLGWLDKSSSDEVRREVINHPFLKRICKHPLTVDQLSFFMGQWYHLLCNFSPYLARTISNLVDPSAQTFAAKILYQELGEGDPSRAHLALFVETMSGAGLNRQVVVSSPPIEETVQWVAEHWRAAESGLAGLSFLYGTEKVDLPMVSSVGRAIRLSTGVKALPWVDIHAQQEGDHVSMVNEVVKLSFTDSEKEEVLKGMERVWELWRDFFTGVERCV